MKSAEAVIAGAVLLAILSTVLFTCAGGFLRCLRGGRDLSKEKGHSTGIAIGMMLDGMDGMLNCAVGIIAGLLGVISTAVAWKLNHNIGVSGAVLGGLFGLIVFAWPKKR